MKTRKSVLAKGIAILLAVVLSAAVLAGCGSSSSSSSSSSGSSGKKSTTVNIGIQPAASYIPIFIAKDKGWLTSALKKQGVTVKWNDFEAGPPMNESMASGKTDVGFLGDVPAVSAIGNGQKNEFVAVSAEGPNAYALQVAKNSSINSVKDLKGKTVGITVGSTAQNVLQKLLEKNGMTEKDVKVTNISAGDTETVLTEKSADAVLFWEPTVTRLEDKGVAKTIAKAGDANQLCVNVISANKAYAQANPKVIQTIIEQYARGVAAIDNLDASTTKKVAKYLSVKPDQVKTIASHYDYTIKPKSQDTDALQDVIKFLVDSKNLKKSYQVKDYITTKYTDKADIDKYLK